MDHKIPLHNWPSCVDDLNIGRFNIGIVVSFGYLIPSKIISKFPMGMINLHASLLPRWRGAAPIVHAIANGDDKTGVSIMKIEPKHFDIGDILYQEEVLIDNHILMPELFKNLAEVGSKLIIKTVQNCPECFNKFTKQNDLLVSYAPKISLEMTEIKWQTMTAKKIYNLYRALYGYKSLSTKFRNLNIKIIEISFKDFFILGEEDSFSKQRCGSIKYCKEDDTMIVLCKHFEYIKVKKLKVEGKKIMTAAEFNNGFLKKLNERELLYFE
ncbi:methionyl-tRNA formyltransferase, mitochondrial isoform X2 [Condylostylus longicornis]|nr:methionyl-tRNA formyltransferase, mitochondrial isoform X2 [Condylostylus longicornis]XP_055371720.1 methionyl-tRNA formyltransferase, mitochondrial isoform X2 [Condylostylus longicornis]